MDTNDINTDISIVLKIKDYCVKHDYNLIPCMDGADNTHITILNNDRTDKSYDINMYIDTSNLDEILDDICKEILDSEYHTTNIYCRNCTPTNNWL